MSDVSARVIRTIMSMLSHLRRIMSKYSRSSKRSPGLNTFVEGPSCHPVAKKAHPCGWQGTFRARWAFSLDWLCSLGSVWRRQAAMLLLPPVPRTIGSESTAGLPLDHYVRLLDRNDYWCSFSDRSPGAVRADWTVSRSGVTPPGC